MRPELQGQERRSRRREAVRPSLQGTGVSSTRSFRALHVLGRGSPGSRGQRSFESRAGAHGRWGVLEPSGSGGSRIRGVEGESFEGEETREQRPVAAGQPNVGGTVSRGEESFEVGEAGGTWRFRRAKPRTTGKRAFGCTERESIVLGGSRQPRESVGVGETEGERRSPARQGTPVDNCKGASGLERGARSS